MKHEITDLRPLDRGRYRWVASCACGWQSEECKTSGSATSAGWAHIREHAEVTS